MNWLRTIVYVVLVLINCGASSFRESENLGELRIDLKPSSSKSHSNANIINRNGEIVLTLEKLNTSHYHRLELHGDEIFWIKRTGDYEIDSKWEDQLWVSNIRSKKQEKLISYKGIDFRASDDGTKIAFEQDNDIKILDRNGNNVIKVSKKGEGGRDDGFTLLAWSSDGKKFWFGAGVVDSWSKLGLYENSIVRWFPYAGGSVDEAFDPSRGWLVVSDKEFSYEAEAEEAFKVSAIDTHLTLSDVLAGKTVELVKARANQFNPKWRKDGSLEYQIKGKLHDISVDQIQKKLKSVNIGGK